MQKVIILADGDYPTHPLPVAVLQSGLPVVCCDGAANRFVAEGGIPTAIIGDGDSLSDEVRERFAHLIHHVAEQETNDLTKTVTYASQQGASDICILGATGKRECHTLGNISLLMQYHRQGLSVRMLTDHCEIIPCSGVVSLSAFPGQQVSIINMNACNFSSIGLRYPIYDFQEWWQGTLNEATANTITIQAQGDYLVLMDFN
jgi:thiamine pyrophosphokinase